MKSKTFSLNSLQYRLPLLSFNRIYEFKQTVIKTEKDFTSKKYGKWLSHLSRKFLFPSLYLETHKKSMQYPLNFFLGFHTNINVTKVKNNKVQRHIPNGFPKELHLTVWK